MSHENDKTVEVDVTCDGGEPIKDIPVPANIGRYRIRGIIGKGGFGTVFRAVDDLLNRDVALKVPQRFQKVHAIESDWNAEARMVAMLDHPHIVPVYDVGSTDEFPFFVVSRFIDGIDLRHRLTTQKPSLDLSIDWVTDMADALQHAHERGLVHRDVKPSNILIEQNDRAWLTDFGLAIHEDDTAREAQRRLLIGTLSYMSPEQARGEGHLVDGRADIFALGIVLYELILGRRPFTGGSSQQLLRNIVRAEPRPLRQVDPNVDRELERICMKALAQRLSDRYGSGREMADDLRRFSNVNSTADYSYDFSLSTDQAVLDPGEIALSSDAASRPTSASTKAASNKDLSNSNSPPVVPKGLRSFDEHDQSFFLKLVPGIRDSNGVPEVLRRLKLRLESDSLDDSFRVGLLYGASGSGKSSLVRAGLIPLLNDSTHVVYIESNAFHTESRLLSSLSSLVDSENQDPDAEPVLKFGGKLSLAETMTAIRKGAARERQAGRPVKKVVLVLDQFEQWLHSHPVMEGAELIDALRQCDGVNLQCMVLIRDDFWMPVTRFFYELDIRIIQDVNSVAVDRFDLRHARYVFGEFGRAYGCLPEEPTSLSDEQLRFMDAVIDSVQENGKVISVHLVVLAQVLKSRPWNLQTLSELGGIEGLDVNFLDATFNDSVASPHHRSMREPARAVLAELLPEMGTDIKGQMQDIDHLRAVSKLNEREFADLVDALDGELRMITPTVSDDDDQTPAKRSYQLTHDFLVPPLREWLTRSQRATPRGRAKLRMQELTEYWKRKHESRFLPGGIEFLQIWALTRSSDRNPVEAKWLRATIKHHVLRWASVALLIALLSYAVLWSQNKSRQNFAQQELRTKIQSLLAADTGRVLDAITNLAPTISEATPLVQAVADDPKRSFNEVLAARSLLVERDERQVGPLIESVQHAGVDQLVLISERLTHHSTRSSNQLWAVLDDESADESYWLKACFTLAQLSPQDNRWQAHAERLARVLVNRDTTEVVTMAEGFSKISCFISNPLIKLAGTGDTDDIRLNAAIVLSKCLTPNDPSLAELLTTSKPDQFNLLLRVAREDPSVVMASLKNELTLVLSPSWDDGPAPRSKVDPLTRETIEASGGILTDAFAMCQQVPMDEFLHFANQLDKFGYQPSCIRAYAAADSVQVAAIFNRDQLSWQFTTHANGEGISETESDMRGLGLYPMDMTLVPALDSDDSSQANEIQYGVLWSEPVDSMIDSRIYLDLTEQDHQSKGWQPLFRDGYVPKTNLKIRRIDGLDRYSSIRWRTVSGPQAMDSWNDAPFDYQMRRKEGKLQTDVRINPNDMFDEHGVSFAGVWWNGGEMTSMSIEQAKFDQHVVHSKKLVRDGFRPVSISSLWDVGSKSTVTSSVWHRPLVSDDQKDELADRQANAVIALAKLGSAELMWPLLGDREDRRIRTFLIHRMSALGVDPELLLERLWVESDNAVRTAIIAAVSTYRPDQISSESTARLRASIQRWGCSNASGALHSICDYICRRQGWDDVAMKIADASLPIALKNDEPTWHKNGQGQTMVAIAGPVRLTLGSPGNEAYRDHELEFIVETVIPRSFAIGVSEVTVNQFKQYDSSAAYGFAYTPSSDCPMTAVNWIDAVRYCRWLSEQEGIAEDQMCYPAIAEIDRMLNEDGQFEVPKDMLARTGYRLPTEAEWEFAARANSTTPRHYGNAAELLPKYAWTTDSATEHSRVRFQPVKQLMPNEFGLFDMLGNVMEWCELLPNRGRGNVRLTDDSVVEIRRPGERKVLRGSAVFYVPTTMRSAKREYANADAGHPYFGFRVARTLP